MTSMAQRATIAKASSNAAPRQAHHPETVVLFAVANQMFAVAADAVQEVRSTDSLAGSAMEIEQIEIGKVRHTIERARRRYFVVNAGMHFGLPVTRPTLVLILRNLRIAVLIDRIERMAEISSLYALPLAFAGDERRWYRGLAKVDDMILPVIEPGGFLTDEEFRTLDLALQAVKSEPEPYEGVAPA
ncbi:MAG TPA: chemotaxis protein CheW [Candidatus Dormibacteraeota bacterium]|nr:chemotaxis protein CheW [Candidatus Dormibacteraeota bacterium]